MKDNSNPDVCPCGEQSIARTKYYCREQWAESYKLELIKAGHVDPERYIVDLEIDLSDDGRSICQRDKLYEEFVIGRVGFYESDWICKLDEQGNIIKVLKPMGLLLWEKQNPMPKVNHIDFTVQLAQRVEHLESLLREKGVEV